MAKQFLDDNQNTSSVIEKAKVGDIIVVFFGTMHADEKWELQVARGDVDPADRDWQPLHPTDNVDATGDDIVKWMGPRDNDRVFYFPNDRDFVYRARKRYGPADPPGTNTAVTACWAERKTTLQR